MFQRDAAEHPGGTREVMRVLYMCPCPEIISAHKKCMHRDPIKSPADIQGGKWGQVGEVAHAGQVVLCQHVQSYARACSKSL